MNRIWNCQSWGMKVATGLLGLALGAGLVEAGAAEKGEGDAEKPAAPAVHTVKRVALGDTVEVEAVLEAVEMFPVSVEPKAWTDLVVQQAAAHGVRVKKGDVLLAFERDKFDEQLKELEDAQPGSRLALVLAGAELDNLRKTAPLKLEAARRSKRSADEDYDYWVKVGREQREKAARFRVKNAEQSLRGAQEELTQLKKMYEADDLTEETEEIVLERQKYAVESAEYFLESSRLSADRDLSVNIPREAENLKNAKLDQEFSLAYLEKTQAKSIEQKKLGLEKLRRDQDKAEKKIADFKADQDLLTVRSPADGLVYYGACEDGRWTTGGAVAKKLSPGGKLAPREVALTIVNPDRLLLRTTIPEDKLGKLRPGMGGRATAISAPDRKLKVRLDELSYVPRPGGGFAATLSFEPDPEVRLMPGMNCKVNLGEGDQPKVLAVPKESVFEEDGRPVVYLAGGDDKPRQRAVKLGKSDSKWTEITDGLGEGDKILLSKPAQP